VNESIADVKTGCVECFASVALAEQLQRADTDLAMKNLLKQRPLDPFRDNLMKSIRSMRSYVDGEITKADAALDDQWQEYQIRRQNKRFIVNLMRIKHTAFYSLHNYNVSFRLVYIKLFCL